MDLHFNGFIIIRPSWSCLRKEKISLSLRSTGPSKYTMFESERSRNGFTASLDAWHLMTVRQTLKVMLWKVHPPGLGRQLRSNQPQATMLQRTFSAIRTSDRTPAHRPKRSPPANSAISECVAESAGNESERVRRAGTCSSQQVIPLPAFAGSNASEAPDNRTARR
jgi:hypothetical protein